MEYIRGFFLVYACALSLCIYVTFRGGGGGGGGEATNLVLRYFNPVYGRRLLVLYVHDPMRASKSLAASSLLFVAAPPPSPGPELDLLLITNISPGCVVPVIVVVSLCTFICRPAFPACCCCGGTTITCGVAITCVIDNSGGDRLSSPFGAIDAYRLVTILCAVWAAPPRGAGA